MAKRNNKNKIIHKGSYYCDLVITLPVHAAKDATEEELEHFEEFLEQMANSIKNYGKTQGDDHFDLTDQPNSKRKASAHLA